MRIFGIDTSTKFLCIGIYDDGKIYEYRMELGTLTSSLLVPTIERIMSGMKWDLKDVDYLACGLGPGSFTGIRVGLSTIKGLSWILHKEVIGISTLDIIASNVREPDKLVVPVIDAKRNLIYCSGYRNNRRKWPYLLLTREELFKRLKYPPVLLGDAIDLYKTEFLSNIKGARLLDKDCWYPRGNNIVMLALEMVKSKDITDCFDVKPIYLYPKECQIRK